MIHRLTRAALVAVLAVALAPGVVPEAGAVPDAPETGTIEGTFASRMTSRYTFLAYLEDVEGEFEPPAEPVIMDQERMTFIPHVLPILEGTTVRFRNSDGVPHNVLSPDADYDLGSFGPGRHIDRTFDEPGVYVQLCRLHTDMEAYVVVLENPFFSIVSEDGSFTIEDVPAGEHRIKLWMERLPDRFARRTYDVTVRPGQTAHPTVSLR